MGQSIPPNSGYVNKPSATVRPASTADAGAIAKLGARVFASTFGHSVPPPELQAFLDDAYSVSAILQDLQDPNKDTFVADSPERDILGFAVLARNSSDPCVKQVDSKVELLRIYVDDAQHGKGIGRMLYAAIEESARQQGFRNMWLGVWEENHKAQKVYEAWGYRQVGAHDFVIGSIVQTDHIMIKQLS